MATKVQKWGNSLAVRFPKSIVEKLALRQGSEVAVLAKKRGVVIVLQGAKKPSLKELVGRITPENRHAKTDWGKPVGKEVW